MTHKPELANTGCKHEAALVDLYRIHKLSGLEEPSMHRSNNIFTVGFNINLNYPRKSCTIGESM